MKKRHISIIILLFSCIQLYSQRLSPLPEITPAGKGIVVPYADNIYYWVDMVRQGYVNPQKTLPWVAPRVSSPRPSSPAVPPVDGPDVAITSNPNVTQSENSIFIDPDDEFTVLNSNNSSDWYLGYVQDPFGADAYSTSNSGLMWGGNYHGAGGVNKGDPTTAISRDGRWYVGMISNTYGQSVAVSTDRGATWEEKEVAQGPQGYGLLDKNQMTIDNSETSPFEGNVYVAWTNFITGNPDTNQVQVSRTNDGGEHWLNPYTVSRGVNAGKLNHGVNLATGPLGEVYMAWSIYDTWPSDETAIGFTRSMDGGLIWSPANRIVTNIKGIRNSMTGKAMRVHSFPSMAVDLSSGPNRGTIYMVWCNVGFPGINTGNDIDVYLVKSTDQGTTWSTPVKVNQDPSGLGKQHYFPWISVDAVTGGICVIYYDDRNVSSTEAETWVSWSYDGGNSFSDMRVSDVAFTPTPVPGLAYNYFGDYIGIQAQNMKVYPVWTDNRMNGGQTLTWTSPFDLGPNPGQPWVMYYSNELTSVSSGQSSVLRYGDSLHMTLTVKNIGDMPSGNVLVRVSSPSEYIRMTDSLETYSSLQAGTTGSVTNGFAFKVSDTIPDNLKVRFDVHASNNDSSWNSHFSVDSHAPGLKILNMTIHDQNGGNNNGRFDPGETVDVTVSLVNTGDYLCAGTYGILNSLSPYLDMVSDSAFADTVRPFQFCTLHFTVSVSDTAPTSEGVVLYFTAHSGNYIRHASFYEIIGIVVEDWETNSFTRFPWHFGGNTSWNVTNINPYEGSYCAVSGQIGDLESSQVYVTYTSGANDSISFYFKTSTEEDYDFLNFFIDYTLQYSWSGENPWSRVAFPVAAGTHTFKWTYQKDLAASGGSDQVGLDFIVFPQPVVPDISVGPDDSVCAGLPYQLQATAQQYDSLHWLTTGDGSFSDSHILEPIYTPGGQDIINGSVRLKLTAYKGYGRSIRGMNLAIKGRPVASISVFPKDTVCHWQTIRLSADPSGVSSYLWTPGNFTTQVLTVDTAIAGGLGTKTFRLTTWNQAGCQNHDSVEITFKNCLGIAGAPEALDMSINPNPAKDEVLLEIHSPMAITADLMVEDMQQNLVYSEAGMKIKAATDRKILNLERLPQGMYLVRLKTSEGLITRKMIIRR
jgi:hypothetical protein